MKTADITVGEEYLVKIDHAQQGIARVEEKGVAVRVRSYGRGAANSGVKVVTTEDSLKPYGGGLLPSGSEVIVQSRDIMEPASDEERQRIRFRVQDYTLGQRVKEVLKDKGIVARYRGSEIALSVQDAAKLAGLSEGETG